MKKAMTNSWDKEPDTRPSMAELEALFTQIAFAN